MDSNERHEEHEKLKQKLVKEFNHLADQLAILRSETSQFPGRLPRDIHLLERSVECVSNQFNQTVRAMRAYFECKQQVSTEDLLRILSVYLPAMNVAQPSVTVDCDATPYIIRAQARILEEDLAPVIKLCSQAIVNNIKDSIPEFVTDRRDQLIPASLDKQ